MWLAELSLADWQKHGFASRPELTCVKSAQALDTIPRINYHDVTKQQFIERFEKPNLPVIIAGGLEQWQAVTEWTYEKLGERFGESKFKCGEDDDGYPVKLRLKYYLEYVKSQKVLCGVVRDGASFELGSLD